MMNSFDFYKGKRVFVTGHTGFKGSWLCLILHAMGANVTGYALRPDGDPSLFELTGLEKIICSCYGDIRDFDSLKKVFDETAPEIVFHLAAQPIVRESYRNPLYTYETNVMGTVNLLECVRLSRSTVKSVINVTTDKVYENSDSIPRIESDILNGFDPYSNSKSCSELVTSSYIKSFFSLDCSPAVSTVRAGNVIGGGDFGKDRLVPDCFRAVSQGKKILVRNPRSIRPFQYVLDPLSAYISLAQLQYDDKKYSGCYNVGPDDANCISSGELTNLFCRFRKGAEWYTQADTTAPYESSFLKLDCTKIKDLIGWRPKTGIEEAVQKTCEWYQGMLDGQDMFAYSMKQIEEYFREANE